MADQESQNTTPTMEDIQKLKKALDAARDERDGYLRELKGSKAKEREALDASNQAAAELSKIKEGELEKKGEYEKLKEGFIKDKKELESKLELSIKNHNDFIIKSALFAALGPQASSSKTLEFLVLEFSGLVELSDGKVVVKDDHRMPLEDLIKKTREIPAYQPRFRGDGFSGGGAGSASTGGYVKPPREMTYEEAIEQVKKDPKFADHFK